tara:strand:- start:17325 stop:17786 length:462 start_codon:yes stop_codon:yes gene_type:complete
MYDYHQKKKNNNSDILVIKKESYAFKELKSLKQNTNKKNNYFLDYGSGSGIWTNVAILLNFKAYAYEPSSKRSLDSGLEVLSDLNNLDNIKFDIINLEQVLEHIPNPADVLKKLCKFANNKTIFRIRVPNIDRSKEGKSFFKNGPIMVIECTN